MSDEQFFTVLAFIVLTPQMSSAARKALGVLFVVCLIAIKTQATTGFAVTCCALPAAQVKGGAA